MAPSSDVGPMPIRSVPALSRDGSVKDTSAVPMMNGVRWSAGFIRSWISTLSVSLPSQRLVEEETDQRYVSSTAESSSSPKSTHQQTSTSTDLPPRAAVRAVFFHSFLKSLLAAHKRVGPILENGVIVTQINKYGRQIPRVNHAMHAYWTHFRLSPLPDVSFGRALESLGDAQPLGSTPPDTAHTAPDGEDDLLLITEELYMEDPQNPWYDDKPRHTFTIQSVNASDIPQLQSQGVLILAAEHWKSLNATDITYYDYFLAFDEQPYTTFLSFIARLHIITSASYVSVAADGRLFVAYSLAIVYSAYDSLLDAPACDRVKSLMEFPESQPELIKELEPVFVHGPGNIKVATYLATPAHLRRLLVALETECRSKTNPSLEYNWAVRTRNYALFTFPNVCKAAIKLAIGTCKASKMQPIAPAAGDEEKEGAPKSGAFALDGDDSVFTVHLADGSTTNLALPSKHFIFSDRVLENSKNVIDREEYVLCSIRASIDSEFCGCTSLFERMGDNRHRIGFDCTIRADDWSHAKSLSSELGNLFKRDLINLSLGRENAGALLHTSSRIAFLLRELGLVRDSNFNNETLSVVDLCRFTYGTDPLFAMACGYRPITQLHDFVMCPRGQHASYEQDAEVMISKIAALSIVCCAVAVFKQAKICEGTKASVLHSRAVLKNSHLSVPEASMVVNLILKALNNAQSPLIWAVLGTQEEMLLNWSCGPGFRDIVDRHPLIASCHPSGINARNMPPCGCVVCIAVATTQLNGTWRTDLLQLHLLQSFTAEALAHPFEGATNLLSALVLARRPFISQRNSNFVMYNALVSNLESSKISDQGRSREFDLSARNVDNTQDEVLQAYWNSDDMDATCRVRTAMIIGAQSTDVDMEASLLSTGDTNSGENTTASRSKTNGLCHATFKWPGWLCSLIVEEAREFVPAGTAHWAAARAVALARTEAAIPPITPHLAAVISHTKDPTNQASSLSQLPLIPSKRSIIQPHPVYNWQLERIPTAGEAVLLDIKERQMICCRLEDIAGLRPQPVFISHIWETPWHPDPTGRQINKIIGKGNEAQRYLWLDYMCLPQGTRNPAEKERFTTTLQHLSALQSHMRTVAAADEYDKVEWERRGWCVVEAIVGNVSAPFAQSVFTHFQTHKTLADVFSRLRIQVTNQRDVTVLEMVLNEWLAIRRRQTHQPQSAASAEGGSVSDIRGQPTRFPLVFSVAIPPNHQELESAKAAAATHREMETNTSQ